MKIVFADQAWDDCQPWVSSDAKALARLNSLIEECRRNPFKGTGKPEPLCGDLQGWWSRRITHEDRLVYRVQGKDDEQRLEIAQCRFHY
ncbi:Txe/YoeB family addiction module toxin [Sphingomonas colocasiae]|uniref:Putative mRNA interferase YoeB n=1 Tax=Sphingomonas colocasiae TaxID=1848973 RepID=A0ABS7PPI5_9SPHN|nr:Txe/YoeB family addiction module toxin [Sphingomonas colocasiae]MBY8823238.1 Txe/YoeB family addiction module toxin [Sphingomonas colocasiae]